MNDSNTIREIFKLKTIAVVGMSPKQERPSHYVAMYLKENGYTIYPVNPGHDKIAGMDCYPDLESIPDSIDVVDIFRRSEFIPLIVDSAISIGAKAVWMQDTVIHEEAGKKAEEAGLLVVMNDCMLRQHRKLF
ncbi:MAG TPA: CoA-binding protein [Candidatus Marinimicrobia bacterium]|nr:CoA-binding protein [Candidatus Neomarinimicrobiota bacterium]